MKVDVKEAAAFPVVWRAALYGIGREALGLGGAPDLVRAVERGAAGLWLGSDDFAARALATAALAARIFAEEPVAERLMLFSGSARSASWAGVSVERPCWR